MSRGNQLILAKTASIPKPNEYIQMMLGEYASWTFTEEEAPLFKGKWQTEVFKNSGPIDLEIGTGSGYHFAHYGQSYPDRNLVGLELKYKPLIQSIRRARMYGCSNTRMVRYNATLLRDLFAEGELSKVMIHFPDPWSKKRQKKHRLLQVQFLNQLHLLQTSGQLLEFKTDNKEYFDWAIENFAQTQYKMLAHTHDLHNSQWVGDNFITGFESLFLNLGLKINFALFKVE